MKSTTAVTVFALLFMFSSGSINGQDYSDFFKSGGNLESYDFTVDINKENQQKTYHLRSINDLRPDFGTIMKCIKPELFAGNRVIFKGTIKTEDVENWAGMWMRVDGTGPLTPLAIDDMSDRPLIGTSDWKKFEIVLDVHKKCRTICFGLKLEGKGKVWFKDVSMEIAGKDALSTNMTNVPLEKETENYSELPEKLKKLPDGLEVKVSPEIIYAEINKEDTSMYYWFYKTTVRALNENIEITEFGHYTWYLNHWEFSTTTGLPLEKEQFENWFKCKDGIIVKGESYIDEDNWYRLKSIEKTVGLWYYIGKNSKGELFKGTSIVQFRDEIKK